jgi:PAS domain S-box-containing protein
MLRLFLFVVEGCLVSAISEGVRWRRRELETRVRERNAALEAANARLQAEIAEHEQTEAALRASEARFAGIVELSADAIIVLDEAQRIRLFNQGAETIFGYRAREVMGKPLDLLMPRRFQGAHHEHIDHFGKTPEVTRRMHERGEVYGRRKDGSEFPAEASISKMRLKDEIVFTVFLRDASERKRVETELRENLARERELNDLKSRFTSMVSHEFRTPLAIIHSSTEILERYSDRMEPQRRAERLETIKAHVHHITHMLDTILYVGRAQAAGLEFTPERHDLVALCRQTVDEMRLIVQDNRELRLEHSAGRLCVPVDRHLFRLMLSNLITNAVKYSPGGGAVHVTLAARPGVVEVRVRDRGIGIPEADRARLFEPYFRATNVGTISGTGLGLALTQHVVELHGGDVQVESEVGVGTTFIITLPAPDAAGGC